MDQLSHETVEIRTSDDVVRVRQAARRRAIDAGLGLVDQTKIVTAASELARNTLEYGGGGTATLEFVEQPPRRGLRITFRDNGPGIPDIDVAMADGYSTGSGLGLGLGGARRLSSEFTIDSIPGKGTTVAITRWKI